MPLTDLADLDRRHIWRPFTQAATADAPLQVERGEGAWLHGPDGRRWLDLISSWWVNLHGHTNPEIARAIAEQAATLEHVIFAGFSHRPAVELAAALAEILPGDLNRVFYSDNGSTAVEVALKVAWQYARNRGEGQRRRFLAFDGGYHGDTFGAMSAGRSSGFFSHYEDLFFDVRHLPYPATWDGDGEVEAKEAQALAALDSWLSGHGHELAGFIFEPLVQGASGMRMARPGFLRTVVERVRAAGALVILDEVMTGFGRTGDLFACETLGIVPDLICLSKGLTGGFLPMAVTVCRDGVYDAFLGPDFSTALAHGHSYTANPLGCAAALASLKLTRSDACTQARRMIAAVHRRALDGLRGLENVTRIRQQGTIAAFDVTGADGTYGALASRRMQAAFLEQGLLLRPLGATVYLMPPYAVSEGELDEAWRRIARFIGGR